MERHGAWQVGGGDAAELYQRHLVPAITSLWAADLVGRAAPRPGERVLDVACGTGVVSRLAAERMGSGCVVGLDINARMLAIARSLPPAARAPIQWCEASALALPFPASAFDLCLCQLGLQFFPDPPGAVREMARVLRPGGRLALSVYSAIGRTPVAQALADALDRHLGPGASATKRSEHALADPGELRELAVAAGFGAPVVHAVTQTIRFPSARDYVRLQIAATPMAGLVAGLEDAARDAVVDAVAGDLAAALGGAGGPGLASPQEAHVLLAWK